MEQQPTPELIDWAEDQIIALRECRGEIEAALKYTAGPTHTFNDIVSMVMTGRLLGWWLDDCWLLTEIHSFPQCTHLHIFLGGGHLAPLINMHSPVIEHARALGCTHLTLSGRRGWDKVLSGHGWKRYGMMMALDITEDD